MIDTKLLKQAIEKWGIPAQTDMIQEEAMELALALHHLKRKSKDREKSLEAVYDELADNEITLKLARLIFDSDKIDERITYKMTRLAQRLGNLDEL